MTACVTPKRDRVPLVWGLFAQIQLHLRSQNCVYIFFFSFLRKKSYVKTKSKAISPDFDLQISIYHIYRYTTGLNLLHGAKFQRFLSGKSVFLNSKFQIREFHAH